ncbi:major facilitator superfamily domain-containing protein [Rhodocollybia butyracea]|uniref:Major facilitator superfamily domain-containing protein n=1 Tax=Rhodocollybia butyracea TaxID=206335 RepID=A0A9P5P3S2_9AGAR|nr:major facilitator superfamily domain-containing protein [Rhodocollybia butyracea]
MYQQSTGWLVASFLNIYLLYYLDLWKTLVIASIVNVVGSAIVISSPPFPIFVIALFLIGIGVCIYDASFAAFTAHFDEGPAMSLLFAAFGLGALIAPLVVVALLDNNVPWNIYYYVPLAISILNIPFLWIISRDYRAPEEENATTGIVARFTLVVYNHTVLTGGLLTALSMASGEILTSWMVSFMTDVRHGNASKMRYVLSGYWVGLVFGRLILAHATSRIGSQTALVIYGILAISLLTVLQFVDNISGNAIAAAFTGFFQAPSTPVIISLSSKSVPSSLVGSAVSVLTAFGLIGSAFGPLCVGFVNQADGLKYLPAITMGAIGVTLGVWCLAPSAPWMPKRVLPDLGETLDMRGLTSEVYPSPT